MRATGVANPVTSAEVYARWASGLSARSVKYPSQKSGAQCHLTNRVTELRGGRHPRVHELRNGGNKLSRGEWSDGCCLERHARPIRRRCHPSCKRRRRLALLKNFATASRWRFK
jgi:hypothetical protein